jgi:hypothetical protein
MAQTQDWINQIIKSAVQQHKSNGNEAPSPETLSAVRDWATANHEAISRAVLKGKWNDKEFVSACTQAFSGKQVMTLGDDDPQLGGSSPVVNSLNKISNGCNC